MSDPGERSSGFSLVTAFLHVMAVGVATWAVTFALHALLHRAGEFRRLLDPSL